MTDRFHGDGFAKTPIEGDEAAKHRHMFNAVQEEWSAIDAAVTVARAVSVISSIIKVGGPVALLCLAAGAYLKAQGIL